MKLIQEVRFELLLLRVMAIIGGQQKMVLSVKLAEEVPWSNFLWEKLVKVVSNFFFFSCKSRFRK